MVWSRNIFRNLKLEITLAIPASSESQSLTTKHGIGHPIT